MKWLVVGSGVSGQGACQLLLTQKKDIYIYDDALLSDDKKQYFAKHNINILAPVDEPKLQEGLWTLVLSPGVSPEHPLIQKAKSLNHQIITEIDLGLSFYRGKIISVTGTNGKSTTVMMITHLLKKCGYYAEAAGNIGLSLCTLMAKNIQNPPDYIVLELSSYQLEQSLPFSSDVAIFTSFSHDHIARHNTLKEYFLAKWQLFSWQEKQHLAIATQDVLNHAKQFHLSPENIQAQFKIINSDIIPTSIQTFLNTKFVNHDLINVSFAITAIEFLLQLDISTLLPLLLDFQTLPFRFEKIGYIQEFAIINDSKSTNVESTLKALKSIQDTTILLLGGAGKDESYTPILEYKEKIILIIAFGKSRKDIIKDLSPSIKIKEFSSFKEMSYYFPELTKKLQSSILFSPAGASFDEFKNFEERGEAFNQSMRPFLDQSKIAK